MKTLNLRPATPTDVPQVLRFIRDLAEYEREPDAVHATEADLLRDGFGETKRFDCIIAELTRAQHAIGDTTLSKEQRGNALKFLIHFVGDLHQPLHAIDNHDKGGNDVHVTIGGRRTTNLHSVWDSVIINSRGRGEEAYANFLIEDLKQV